jgi:hypothetical protein
MDILFSLGISLEDCGLLMISFWITRLFFFRGKRSLPLSSNMMTRHVRLSIESLYIDFSITFEGIAPMNWYFSLFSSKPFSL